MIRFLENIKTARGFLSPLVAFFAGAFIMYIANGLNSSILAIRLNAHQLPTFYSGLVLSSFYLAYIVSTLTAYRVINRIGHIRAFLTYMSILSSLVLMHAFAFSPIFWAILRFGEGYCVVAGLVCLESWLNTRANNKNRGMVMSVYMVMSYGGLAIGQLMLNIPDHSGYLIFVLVSILYSWALVPVGMTNQPAPDIKEYERMSLLKIYKIAPLSVLGCIASGVLAGNVYTLGPIYAKQIGLSLQDTSLFMFSCIIGGLLMQIPIGRLSDRMDRRFIMMWICGILFLVAPWTHLLIEDSRTMLIGCALLLGAGTFTLYPICISHLNDKIADTQRVQASGMLLLLQSVGMMSGPIVISLVMQAFGVISFLLAFSIVNGIFILFALRYITFRPNVNYITITKTDPMPPAPSTVFSEISQPQAVKKKIIKEKKNAEVVGIS